MWVDHDPQVPVFANPTDQAMIVWMAKENHTFYVKDLVAYLRDEYRYKGCDGTIRRCLMRAGYRRKLVSQSSNPGPPHMGTYILITSHSHGKGPR